MLPIECDKEIKKNPSVSLAKFWEKKVVDFTLKYGSVEVAKYCPEFHSIDSALFDRKSKLVPKLPEKI